MNIKAAEIVFKSFLLLFFLSLCSESLVKKVQSHINRLLRIVYKQPQRTANEDLYLRSRVLPLELRADAGLLKLQFGMRDVEDKIIIIDVAARHVRRVRRIVFRSLGITLLRYLQRSQLKLHF